MAITKSYQVQKGDRNLLELASRLQTNFQTLKNLNPTVQTISKGQFLNVPPPVQQKTPVSPVAGTNPPKPPAGGLGNPAGMSNFVNASQGAMVDPLALAGGLVNPARNVATMNPYQKKMITRDQPITPIVPTPYAGNPYISGAGGANIGIQTRVKTNLTQMQAANDPSQLPGLVPATDLTMMGVSPSQMLAAGYVLKNGNYVQGSSTVGNSGAGGGGGYIDPKKYIVTWNPNAKNPKNRYKTTLAQIRNRQKRAKHGAGFVQPGVPEVRADAPSTTLDLILGT